MNRILAVFLILGTVPLPSIVTSLGSFSIKYEVLQSSNSQTQEEDGKEVPPNLSQS
jgi:hypothetical protein